MLVEIEVDYEGHETSDVFNLGATVPGTDGSDWAVLFDNGSGEYSASPTL